MLKLKINKKTFKIKSNIQNKPSFSTKKFGKTNLKVKVQSQKLKLNAKLNTKKLNFSSKKLKEPVRVAVTGAAGQIGYGLIFRIASGQLLGADQPVILHCVELPFALKQLKGVAMELEDCAFPLLKGIVQTDDLNVGFKDIDYALLVGSKPRGPGMERGDLLKDNGAIFTAQGKALNDNAKPTCKTIVVGNPANTNCLIAASNAPNIPKENFSAMTRLDHNRGLAQLADQTNSHTTDIENFAIWGNHSATQYPDVTHATVKGKKASELVEQKWVEDTFIPVVQQRGAAIIKARGLSSAASAGNGAIDHIYDWANGTNGKWTSMAIPSDGSYGVEEGVYFSYPVTCKDGKYEIVQGLEIDEFSKAKIEATKKELFEERAIVEGLLGPAKI